MAPAVAIIARLLRLAFSPFQIARPVRPRPNVPLDPIGTESVVACFAALATRLPYFDIAYDIASIFDR